MSSHPPPGKDRHGGGFVSRPNFGGKACCGSSLNISTGVQLTADPGFFERGGGRTIKCIRARPTYKYRANTFCIKNDAERGAHPLDPPLVGQWDSNDTWDIACTWR